MPRRRPYSFSALVVFGYLCILQFFPPTGLLMFIPMSSGLPTLLLNGAMIGIAIEVGLGAAHRRWLALPFVFYSGYATLVVLERVEMRRLAASYAASNARVSLDFDPARQALVFEDEFIRDRKLRDFLWSYAAPVIYSAPSDSRAEFQAHRIAKGDDCRTISQNAWEKGRAAETFTFQIGVDKAAGKEGELFCMVSTPETPKTPILRVSQTRAQKQSGTLPFHEVATTAVLPDGERFELRNGCGRLAPLIPTPRFECAFVFCWVSVGRREPQPFPEEAACDGSQSEMVARALGLNPDPSTERHAANSHETLRMAEIAEEEAMTRQFALLDAMIASPQKRARGLDTRVLLKRPGLLEARADEIMSGIERAAVDSRNGFSAHDAGRTLATLLLTLPPQKLGGFNKRVFALYAAADHGHWLWDLGPLVAQLGDSGPAAAPYLLHPRALNLQRHLGGVHALCRIGGAGRIHSEPALLQLWERWREVEQQRDYIYVALRRIGVTPPSSPMRNARGFHRLQEEWADVSPDSPARVCDPEAERRARAKER